MNFTHNIGLQDITTDDIGQLLVNSWSENLELEKLYWKLKNEYNLNLPRYITKVVKETAIDMEKGKARIREIEQELQEIENRIAIYRRELGL